MLFIVSTPIGNMDDITLRAISTLKSVDFIAAEDTRRTGMLLKRHNISNKLTSYNDKNKKHKSEELISLLRQGQNIALVSDAGTPGINDPGFYLVRECLRAGIEISPIPGANAAISALVCSGLPTDRFSFDGFVPKKPGKRQELIEQIKGKKETAICYESPFRIQKTLEAMQQIIPSHTIVVARELTKLHEQFIRGRPEEILTHTQKNKLKGEIVLLISHQ